MAIRPQRCREGPEEAGADSEALSVMGVFRPARGPFGAGEKAAGRRLAWFRRFRRRRGLKFLKHGGGGGLLRHAARSAPAMRCQRQRLHMAAHFKRLLMRCARNADNGVVWHWQMPGLEPFLQGRFGIFGGRLHLRRDFQPREQATHQNISSPAPPSAAGCTRWAATSGRPSSPACRSGT